MSSAPENANEGCVGPSSDSAGKASACDGCPNQSACASGAGRVEDPAIAVVRERMSQIKHKILVLSGKGGVGKSTVSAQLAFSLAAQGFNVGLLDVDICGPSIPQMLGIVGREVHQSATGWSPVYVDDNLGVMSVAFMLPNQDDAVIWRGPRKNGLIKQFLSDVDWGYVARSYIFILPCLCSHSSSPFLCCYFQPLLTPASLSLSLSLSLCISSPHHTVHWTISS